MKKLGILVLSSVALVVLFYSCNTVSKDETILKGNATIYVDETITPIVEDQVAVFESEYDAKINLVSKSESETLNALFNKKATIAILSRNLAPDEIKIFKQAKINPKITPFATDAIAFVSNASNNDSLVALQDVLYFMQGKSGTKIKGLVFDNLNSSTVRYLRDLAGIKSIPENGVFSFKTNNEVIKHVAANDGLIGVVGVNWLTQPLPSMVDMVDKVRIMKVKGLKSEGYYFPSQNDIAEKKYPLARDLYIINCQGFTGLGMGFASFVGGDIGQRIVLKSGLLPVRIPTRKFTITNSNKDEK